MTDDALVYPPRFAVMRVNVSVSSIEEVLKVLAQMVDRKTAGYVSCANAFSLGLANESEKFRETLNAADIVTTDGVPVVWALKLFGRNCERVHNDDLVLACCERFPLWRHFLVGGREGQPELVAEELTRRFPGIRIAGYAPTPVRPVPAQDTDAIVSRVQASRADVVWAALGTPQQDFWMAEVTKRLDLPLVGCGSLFDLLAGRTRPAADWVKRSGLQWLHRLLQEPRRLAYRYVAYNTKFLLGVTRQYLANKN